MFGSLFSTPADAGYEAGRAGKDPDPPSLSCLDRFTIEFTGFGEKVAAQTDRDHAEYLKSYRAGATQRLADQSSGNQASHDDDDD